jgi:hypothetical protein
LVEEVELTGYRRLKSAVSENCSQGLFSIAADFNQRPKDWMVK